MRESWTRFMHVAARAQRRSVEPVPERSRSGPGPEGPRSSRAIWKRAVGSVVRVGEDGWEEGD